MMEVARSGMFNSRTVHSFHEVMMLYLGAVMFANVIRWTSTNSWGLLHIDYRHRWIFCLVGRSAIAVSIYVPLNDPNRASRRSDNISTPRAMGIVSAIRCR